MCGKVTESMDGSFAEKGRLVGQKSYRKRHTSALQKFMAKMRKWGEESEEGRVERRRRLLHYYFEDVHLSGEERKTGVKNLSRASSTAGRSVTTDFFGELLQTCQFRGHEGGGSAVPPSQGSCMKCSSVGS